MSLAENTYQVVLRLDPDNASSRKGLKRIKLMNSSKNAGNAAFKAGKWQEAEQHYTQAMEVDAHLKSSFMAQCACNRYTLSHAERFIFGPCYGQLPSSCRHAS